ncbi:hypothetical protein Tco_0767678 [Tanacetum coccineum]
MVDSEKIPKDQASDYEGSNIDKYDPLSLYSNETSEVPLINFKLEVWLPLSEYYHKFNALWRQYDSLVNLPDCICENSEKLKKYSQLLKDEYHRSTQSHNVSKSGNNNTAFVARTNPRNNNWSGSNNQPRKLNRPNLVCTHCNMNSHTADRCFELVGYPPIFKRNTGTNKGSASNNVVSGIKDQSAGSSNSFTDD